MSFEYHDDMEPGDWRGAQKGVVLSKASLETDPLPTAGDWFRQNWRDTTKVSNQDATIMGYHGALNEVNDKIHAATGKRLVNPMDWNAGSAMDVVRATWLRGRDIETTDSFQAWRSEVDALRKAHPDALDWDEMIALPGKRTFEAMKAVRERTSEMSDRFQLAEPAQFPGHKIPIVGGFVSGAQALAYNAATSPIRTGTQLAANIAASFTSPIDASVNLLGFGAAGKANSVLKAATANAVTNAVGQLPLSYLKQKDYEAAGLPHGWDVIGEEVAGAAAGGFVLDAAVRGAARGVRKLRGTDAGQGGLIFDAVPQPEIAPRPQKMADISPETIDKASKGDLAATREILEKTGAIEDPATRGALEHMETVGKLDAEALARLDAMGVARSDGMRVMDNLMAGRYAAEPDRLARDIERMRSPAEPALSDVDVARVMAAAGPALDAVAPRLSAMVERAVDARIPAVEALVRRTVAALKEADAKPDVVAKALADDVGKLLADPEQGPKVADALRLTGTASTVEMAAIVARRPDLKPMLNPEIGRHAEALAMSRLAPDELARVAAGEVPGEVAAHIAETVPAERHAQAFDDIARERPASVAEAKALLDELAHNPGERLPKSGENQLDPAAEVEALRTEAGEAAAKARAPMEEREALSAKVETLRGEIAKLEEKAANAYTEAPARGTEGEKLYSIASDAGSKARAERAGFDTSTVYYHGTRQSFDAFDPAGVINKRAETQGSYWRDRPRMVFLSDDPDLAGFWASGEDGRMIPTYLKRDVRLFDGSKYADEIAAFLTENESTIRGQLHSMASVGDDLAGAIRRGSWEVVETPAVQQWLRDNGYDGFKAKTKFIAGKDSTIVAVFDTANDRGAVRSVNAQFSDTLGPKLMASFADLAKKRAELHEAETRLAELTATTHPDPAGAAALYRIAMDSIAERRQMDVIRAVQHALALGRRMLPEGTKVEALPDEQMVHVGKDGTRYQLDGSYERNADLVRIAIHAIDPSAKMGHEAVHALVAHGLLTADEVKALAALAREAGVLKPDDEARYREAYKNRDGLDALIDEEAAAALIEARIKGDAKGPENTIVERIRQFLERLKALLDGYGFRSREDIVRAIIDGDVAQRRVAVAEGKAAMAEAAAKGVTLPNGTQVNGVPLFSIRAFHGSPHDFDRFDMRKIGSGEGAQAFGHGLYFAESEGVARSYQNRLSAPPGQFNWMSTRNAKRYRFTSLPGDGIPKFHDDAQIRDFLTDPQHLQDMHRISRISVDLLRKEIADLEKGRSDRLASSHERFRAGIEADYGNRIRNRQADLSEAEGAATELDAFVTGGMELKRGTLYEVRINAEPDQFLDWDKPLSEQSEKVRALFPNVAPDTPGSELMRAAQGLLSRQPPKPTGDTMRDFISQQMFQQSARDYTKKGASEDALKSAGIAGIAYLDRGSRGKGEGTRNYVVFDDKLIEIVAKDGKPVAPKSEPMFSLSDRETGRSMRRDLDALGYYSAALESAKGLKQAKGTPEQMLAQLKAGGARDAEIEATGLRAALDGKKSVTRDEIVDHLTKNRVGLREVVTSVDSNKSEYNALKAELREQRRLPRGEQNAQRIAELESRIDDLTNADGNSGPKWQRHSLDPSNPTYRETVLHLPADDVMDKAQYIRDRASVYPNETQAQHEIAYNRAVTGRSEATRGRQGNAFRSGHFPEPNITGHMMTSIVKHEGKPTYLVDQIQSDWGQRLRDKGVRDEAKIAELNKRAADAEQAYIATPSGSNWMDRVRQISKSAGLSDPTSYKQAYGNLTTILNRRDHMQDTARTIHRALVDDPAAADFRRLYAEAATAEASVPGHPLVNTTDQWVNTTLRRALRQAAEADADYIAIPTGKTVESYNPQGDSDGNAVFYEKIVPKNLRNLLQKLDKASPSPQHVPKLDTPTEGLKGDGFALFPLTDAVKRAVTEDGQPMFSLRDDRPVTPGLDMSRDARMARAEEMGFDTGTVWYHVTDVDFDAFTLRPPNRNTDSNALAVAKAGIWMSNKPDRVSAGTGMDSDGGRVLPLYVRGDLYDAGNLADVFEMVKNRNWKRHLRDNGYSGIIIRDEEFSRRRNDYDVAAEKTRDDARKDELKYAAEANANWPPSKELDAKWKDAVRRREEANAEIKRLREDRVTTSIAIFDPSDIRSVNAAFDPANADSPNLMYSMREPEPILDTEYKAVDRMHSIRELIEACAA